MVNHKKVYCTFFNLDISDRILCTSCLQGAVDIHHIRPRGMGGSEKDYIENLVALCRKCHDKVESSRSFNKMIRIKHLKLVLFWLENEDM
jgi:5-methylcytosine-specific restriction endonuclease McrA